MNEALVPQPEGPKKTMILPVGPAVGRLDQAYGLASQDSPASGGSALSAYMHAFRRRWLAVCVVGFVCGAGAAAAVWSMQEPKYLAMALLRVASSEQQLVFEDEKGGGTHSFEVYRETQRELMTSRFVLAAAIRKPEVAKLDYVRNQADPVSSLSRAIRVESPKNTEILRVSMVSKNPREAAELINAVVDAYLNEVVAIEQKQRNSRLNELDRAFTEKETEVRNKWNDLRQLTEQLGTGDSQVLTVKQQVQLQRYGELHRQLSEVQAELSRYQSELKVQQIAMEAVERDGVSEEELSASLMSDPQYARLATEITDLTTKQAVNRSLAQPKAAAKVEERAGGRRQAIEAQIEARRKSLRDELRARQVLEARTGIKKVDAQIALLQEQEKRLLVGVNELQKQTEQLGNRSTDVEMMRAEIRQMEDVLSSIGREREQLKVELRSGTRVAQIQPASVPEQAIQGTEMALCGFVFLAGFCCPALGLIWLDVRGHRINASEEVVREVGLNVIGAVPIVPARAMRQLGCDSEQDRHWRLLITESVDGIVARLLRLAERKSARTILISSAQGGEGKTTLAVQLAMNLARTGPRTVLVDFDLRRPAVNKAFALPLEPGVADLLAHRRSLDEVRKETAVENLTVITAGRWDRTTMAPLAGAEPGKVLEQLKEQYEYVIVDGCPILPVADTRFLCRYVDGVIFSVFRDVSRAPLVRKAHEILVALGVDVLGAVVADHGEGAYAGYYSGYGYRYVRPEADAEKSAD